MLFGGLSVHAQKKLSEVQLDNSLLEPVAASALSSVTDSHVQKNDKFKGFYEIVGLKSNEDNRVFKFKGTDEIVQVTSLRNRELWDDWDKAMAGYVATLTGGEGTSREKYVEQYNTDKHKCVIFFVKNNAHGVSNFTLYRDIKKNVVLLINYISDQSDDVKVKNLKKIVEELKIE